MNRFDQLVDDLLRLAIELDGRGIPFLLGGGMGLYVRSTYHEGDRQPRYPRAVQVRPTKDLDIFFTGEVIADAGLMLGVRDALATLGYEPIKGAENFQFEICSAGIQQSRVDLLAPQPGSLSQVKIKGPRIRPKDADGIHAHLTREATAIGIGAIAVPVARAGISAVIHIPSSINYLVLKLHAYSDRRNDRDKAATHALDIVRIVTDMTEGDWAAALALVSEPLFGEHSRRASDIRRAYFDDLEAEGVRALRRTHEFRTMPEDYLGKALDDLRELLHDS